MAIKTELVYCAAHTQKGNLAQPRQVSFGPFVYDPATGKLTKHGYRIKLQRKSAQILDCLLETRGQVVSRAEVERRLWPEGTYVDYELGARVALKKLRDALGDSAEAPNYIETVRGEGYRFIAPVTAIDNQIVAVSPDLAAAIGVEPVRTSWWRRGWLPATCAVLMIFAGFVSWRLLRPKPLLKEPGWVLITAFDNRSGTAMLDGTLEFALERELGNSQFVRVIPRQRVEDALRLMRKPLDSRIDLATGRQICLRDSEIQAVITGRIEKLGTTFVLSVQVVNPINGQAVTTLSEEDPADTLLAATVRRLAARVRESLGEERQTIRQSEDRLAQVTTPSLHALQLYTQAERLIGGFRGSDSNRVAAQLLEQALKDDPDFASAHVMLAHAYTDDGRHEDAAAHFRRGFELVNTTSDRERYFILGSYYGSHAIDEPQKAAEAYETLLRLYPDDYWAAQKLAQLYMFRLHEFTRVTDMYLRLADLRPNDLGKNLEAAATLIDRQAGIKGQTLLQPAWTDSDSRLARHYLDRAAALREAQGSDEPGHDFNDSPRLLFADLDWLEGKIERARTEVRDAERLGKSIAPPAVGEFYFTTGNLRQAEEAFAREPGNAYLMLSVVAFYRGDLDSVRSLLRSTHDPDIRWGTDLAGVMMARTGMLREAEDIRRILADRVKKPLGPTRPPGPLRIVEGELALAHGDSARAIAWLEPMIKWHSPAAAIASEDLADLYRKLGRRADEVRVLESAAAGPMQIGFAAPFLMRLQMKLAQRYRESGREAEAQQIEAQVSRLLALADPDHPIVRQLAALRQVQGPAVVAKK